MHFVTAYHSLERPPRMPEDKGVMKNGREVRVIRLQIVSLVVVVLMMMMLLTKMWVQVMTLVTKSKSIQAVQQRSPQGR
jgi:hypothetical protein